MKERILLGMSGGVDSSSSAVILQNKGYEVVGCTMKLCKNTKKKDSDEAVIDAQKICKKLGIEHHVIDFQKDFTNYVIKPFIKAYQNAITPNPCIECNRYLKFGYLYDIAKKLNCKLIATGHYVKSEYSEKYGQKVLKKAMAEDKDQSYFLYKIERSVIEKIVFPLQDYSDKNQIREIAKENGLEVAEKKDSQEICFIPDNDYQKFLLNQKNFIAKEGDIVLKTGEVLGKHKGLYKYTIGQRKGLGISYPNPLYVIKIDLENNKVIVGEEKDLYNKELVAKEVNWLIDINKLISNSNLKNIEETERNEIEVLAKIRYRAKEAKAKVIFEKDGFEQKIRVVFEEKQRAITTGQAVVFYDEDGILLGGGTIGC